MLAKFYLFNKRISLYAHTEKALACNQAHKAHDCCKIHLQYVEYDSDTF